MAFKQNLQFLPVPLYRYGIGRYRCGVTQSHPQCDLCYTLSAEDPWPSPGDAWPSSPEATWPSTEAASSPLYHGLLPNVKENGKIYNHYIDFFTAHKKHQNEMMKAESPRDCQAHESRNPSVKHAKVYKWEKTQSSGSRKVYK